MASPRTLSPVDLLAELLQGYRRPAAATNEHGAVVCMNAAALNEVDRQLSETTMKAEDWSPLATFKTTDGQTFLLRCPPRAPDATRLPERVLPPRLAKVASLVIGGLTDKKIAQRLGLTFSTVRTYVRQIYRRMGVHSRVALVHVASAGPVRAGDAAPR